MANPVGTEILTVLGVQTNGQPAATTENFTLSQVGSYIGTNPTITGGTITGANLIACTSTPLALSIVNTSIASTGGTTLPASGIVGASITRTGPGSNFTDTTDTGVDIVGTWTALGGLPVGYSSEFFYKNQTNYSATIAAGVGISFQGTLNAQPVIAPNCSAYFLLSPISAGSVIFDLLFMGNSTTGVPGTAYAAVSAASNALLTGIQMAGAQNQTINMTGTIGGASTLTTATALSIISSIYNAAIGDSYPLTIINGVPGNPTWTLTPNTGVAITGTATISAATWRQFYVTISSASSVGIQNVNVGTYS